MAIDEQNISLEQAQQMMAEMSAVNLDEVSPGVITVAFHEFTPGKRGGFVVETTMKEINTWVPMYLFNRMLANQKRMQKLRQQRARKVEFAVDPPIEEEEEENYDLLADDSTLDFAKLTDEAFKESLANSEPALVWQAKEVLTVWKLTPGEEGMSLKRLLLGLTLEQVQGLFTRFFGAMLQKKMNRA